MTTLNMHPVTGPGGRDILGKSRSMYTHAENNGDRGFYSYYMNQGVYGEDSNAGLALNRPVFKIIINPKSHCTMHQGFEPYEYVETKSSKYASKDRYQLFQNTDNI